MGCNQTPAWIIFVAYIIVGLPVGLEQIINKTADLAYFTEIDNWVGSYLLLVLGLIEIIVVAYLMGEKSLEEINKGGIWQMPKWFYSVFMRVLTPVSLIIVLVFSTLDYIKAGYFKFVPDFVAGTPVLIPWVNSARIVILVVVAAGAIQSYKSIKTKYGKEIEENVVSIRV